MVRHLDGFNRLVEDWADTLRKSNEQLRRFERLASIESLASGIAHEINNPLNSILLIARYALKGKSSLDRGEALNSIIAEAERGSRVVRNLLKFAREEQSAKSFGDLNEVVQRAVIVARTYLRPAQVRIETALAPDLPQVLMNSAEIEEVIINLVKNAVESANGKVTVNVQTSAEDERVRVVVSDNGVGVPREILSQIFDPFFTTKRTHGSSGMGLSISHRIIADHGGTLTVHSEPGGGAAFTLEIPGATLPKVSGAKDHGAHIGSGRRS